ncbi:MAG: hypothetical protein M3406_09115 [Chloroflexota bacterium]|nr:hypothetical protein [Chloroflexota bacterium]
MGEGTDDAALIADLNKALPLVARDAIAAAMAAGAMPGPEGVTLSAHLRQLATEEARDIERLAARVASLGGSVSMKISSIKATADWRASVESLVAMQREALEAVVAAIPADADDAEGEASEHLLEHVVSRKRDAIELLERALR